MWFLAAAEGAAEGGGLVTFGAPGHEDWVVLIWTWIAIAVIILIAAAARSGWNQQAPGGFAGMFEHIYHWVDSLAQGMMGPIGRNYVPFTMTIFLLVLVSNWFGLLPGFGAVTGDASKPAGVKFVMSMDPKAEEQLAEAGSEPENTRAHHVTVEPIGMLEAPTGNINTTLALALISFLSFTLFGVHEHYQNVKRGGHGHGHHGHDDGHAPPPPPQEKDPFSAAIGGFISWLGHFVQPTPMLWNSMEGALKYLLVPPMCILFICLNIIEEFARIISLTLRLFGNIAGEHQVKVGLFIVMGVFGTAAIAMKDGFFMAGTSGVLSIVIWGISVFVTLIGALAGFVQAMVFMLLTISYISHAVVLEH